MARAKGPKGRYLRHANRGALPSISDPVARLEDQLRRDLIRQKPPLSSHTTSARVPMSVSNTDGVPRKAHPPDSGKFKPAPFKWSKEED